MLDAPAAPVPTPADGGPAIVRAGAPMSPCSASIGIAVASVAINPPPSIAAAAAGGGATLRGGATAGGSTRAGPVVVAGRVETIL